MKKISNLLLLSFVALVTLQGPILGQSKLRMIEENDPRFTYKNPPANIVSREFKGRILAKGDQFTGDKDWLSNVSFEIKNNFTKPIVYLYMDLVIDGQGKIPSSSEVSFPIMFGNSWAPLGTDSSKGAPAMIKPGEVIRLSVTEYVTGALKKMASQYNIEEYERISIDLRHIHFSDGTGWSVGLETRQDPNDPSRWKVFNPNKRSSQLRLKRWLGDLFG
ncbi:MAG: hypothetical protein QM785_08180 [Pyrinomonadaceae bacterium]